MMIIYVIQQITSKPLGNFIKRNLFLLAISRNSRERKPDLTDSQVKLDPCAAHHIVSN